MALTNAFYEAVKEEDVSLVRIMMKDSLLVDPTFVELSEMEKAASVMNNLYDKYDGKELVEDKKQWNDDYMNEMLVELLFNFSHERIEHLKKIVHHLRPVKKDNISEKKETKERKSYDNHRSSSYKEQKRRDQENGDYRRAKIFTGAAVGAAIGGIIAYGVGAPIVAGIAAGAVVGGGATAVAVNGGK